MQIDAYALRATRATLNLGSRLQASLFVLTTEALQSRNANRLARDGSLQIEVDCVVRCEQSILLCTSEFEGG